MREDLHRQRRRGRSRADGAGAGPQLPRKGDTLVAWKLDRLGRHPATSSRRSPPQGEGIGFRSLQENIDTTTSGGKLVFHDFAALAEFERDIIRERTRAGLEADRARGKRGGRRPKLDAKKRTQAITLHATRRTPSMTSAGRSGWAGPRSTATSLKRGSDNPIAKEGASEAGVACRAGSDNPIAKEGASGAGAHAGQLPHRHGARPPQARALGRPPPRTSLPTSPCRIAT